MYTSGRASAYGIYWGANGAAGGVTANNNIISAGYLFQWYIADDKAGITSDKNIMYASQAAPFRQVTPYAAQNYATWGKDTTIAPQANEAAILFNSASGFPTNCTGMDLRLQAASPGVKAGADLSATFTNDYLGLGRGYWDIGAYSYISNTFAPWSH